MSQPASPSSAKPSSAKSSSPTAAWAQVYERYPPIVANGSGPNSTLTATGIYPPAPGDTLLLEVFGTVESTTNPTGITGWTKLFYDGSKNIVAWYKTATARESATVSVALGSSRSAQSQALFVDVANTSGTPTYAEGGAPWSTSAKTLTGLTTSIGTGGYALFAATLPGSFYSPSGVLYEPFSFAAPENVQSQGGILYPQDFIWGHAVYAAPGSAAPVFFGSAITNAVNTFTSLASSTIVVAPGSALVTASPMPSPRSEAASQADSLVAIMGVNTHISYQDQPTWGNYTDTPAPNGNTVISAVQKLGVRHLRDSVGTENPTTVCGAYSRLTANIRGFDVDVGSAQTDTAATWANDYACLRSAMYSIEGLNEPDDGYRGSGTWQEAAYQQVRALAEARLKGTYFPKTTKIVGSALVHDLAYYELLATVSPAPRPYRAYVDYGNIHPYGAGYHGLDNPGAGRATSYGPLGKLTTNRAWAQVPVPSPAPIWMTEYGVPNSPNEEMESYVSFAGQSRVIVRGMLAAFEAGIARAYIYDLARNNSTDETYGLMDTYLNPAPAFIALQNFITIIKDPGPPFAPTNLSYAINATPDVQHILLQKRDGSKWLILWQSDNDWDTSGGYSGSFEIPVPATTAKIYWGTTPSYLKQFVLSASNGTVSTKILSVSGSNAITVTDMPQVLQIGSAAPEPIFATPQPAACPAQANPCPNF